MFTILTNTYNENELRKLTELLHQMNDTLVSTVCKQNYGSCKVCKYRHLCYDVDRALEFVQEKSI